jgi:autoinducer 2-degrading protein
MTVTCVHVQVKPEEIDRFIKATTENHIESVKEPGNLRFDILQQADDPCRFVLYEAYESDDSAAAHKSTPHYLRWRDTVAGYNIIEPEDKAKW